MRSAVSIAGIVDIARPRGGLAALRQAGFDAIALDLALFCDAWALERLGCDSAGRETAVLRRIEELRTNPGALASQAGGLVSACRAQGLFPAIARAPFLKRDSRLLNQNDWLSALAAACVTLCGQAGCPYLVVRPLVAGVARGDAWAANRDFYLGLARMAAACGVQILLENQCADFHGRLLRGVCAEPDELAAWIDRLNAAAGEERFGACFDVGTANLCGQDLRDCIAALGRRVKAVCLRDCDGRSEASLLPFTAIRQDCTTDWRGVVWGLRDIAFDGLLVYDLASTMGAFPVALRQYILTLAKEMAAYFAWVLQIEARLQKYSAVVLFGAGNMCKNYMEFYGAKYPPLFTCDNDQALWGTRAHGLEVKPPEALKTLPAGCGVFVCNMYYYEIERQLQEMGVGPVECFNDEYLPPLSWRALEEGPSC